MPDPILTLAWKRGQKTWVAFISGRSRQFGFEREFIMPLVARKGEEGHCEYLLEEGGIYEYAQLDERYFIHVRDGVTWNLNKEGVVEILAARVEAARKGQTAAKRKRKRELADTDSIIARFNGEGGFSLESLEN